MHNPTYKRWNSRHRDAVQAWVRMMRTLWVVCVLASLLSTAYAISCVQCKNENGLECSAPPAPCPNNSVCFTFTVQNEASEAVLRTCGHPKYCGQTFSFMDKGSIITFSSSCCDHDGCMPIPRLHANDFRCPFCSMLDYDVDDCIIHHEKKCVGNENRCYSYYTGTGGTKQLAGRGCASENLCAGINETIVPKVLWDGMIDCDGDGAGKYNSSSSYLTYNILLLTFSMMLGV
ncbi:phospholipase A2 inhibitor NAI-like [Pseudophryne corroboree]|uniref:phospholipase A2 inhibitor NAI-like n=1 Tax=Pseudophryne corroboree TaxID=495146 RepID=UPI003081F3C4